MVRDVITAVCPTWEPSCNQTLLLRAHREEYRACLKTSGRKECAPLPERLVSSKRNEPPLAPVVTGTPRQRRMNRVIWDRQPTLPFGLFPFFFPLCFFFRTICADDVIL